MKRMKQEGQEARRPGGINGPALRHWSGDPARAPDDCGPCRQRDSRYGQGWEQSVSSTATPPDTEEAHSTMDRNS